MNKAERYYLNQNGEFVIENYNLAKPFSSFFPGIAGMWGVPTWTFYVNRGQAISSFGISDKDRPIMEFQPANKAYYLTPIVGFRTFIKVSSSKKVRLYDAFQDGLGSESFDIDNSMTIGSCEIKLKETNHTLGIQVDIEYFTIPNDSYGALARIVTVKNISSKNLKLEILDGLPQIIPYGLNNMFLKKLSRTIEAWMGVENLENNVPYLRLKVDPTDRPEVVHIKEGNFYMAFDRKGLKKPIVDPDAIFGKVNNFTYPACFMEKARFAYPKEQLTKSKTPSCMSYSGSLHLRPQGSYKLYTIAGNMCSLKKLKAHTGRIADKNYLIKKQQENRQLISSLESGVFTQSSSKEFDFYCKQNFLDNIMRGGYPLFVKHPKGRTHIQVFSRKHGDMERDYNKFLVEPTYFSQGNGNYRDINQNRRCDVWFDPQLKEENIITFFSLIQIDGYNPLIIRPDRFSFNNNIGAVSNFFLKSDDLDKIKKFLSETFTPGEFFYYIEQNDITLRGKKTDLLRAILDNSERTHEAWHGEGFWIDHWHYCLDMLESYLSLYPEVLRSLLLEKDDFTYYDNGFTVKPRSKKYILHNGKVYQFKSVEEDHHKRTVVTKRKKSPFVSRAQAGHGIKIYKTTLIAKMLTVIANKMASLDPQGIGVEMEADKPGWYDSLNGLPGLLGSSACETLELKRWILFIKEKFTQLGLAGDHMIALPGELYKFLKDLNSLCRARLDDYGFWDKTHSLKEKYRQDTLLGFLGINKDMSVAELDALLDTYLKKVECGIRKAGDRRTGLYHSYFINDVTRYKVLKIDAHTKTTYVKALKFKQRPLPLFLEGMVHALRVTENKNEAKKYFRSIRRSPLYDRELKMYKVNAPLKDMPEEIGRARVFTPGWLENESIWTHMEYKYLLEILKKGLYDEFYEDFKYVIIAFHDPARYGRSILENSSFLVSSVFPQTALHGNGFVARLSGATAEFINMWLIICAGERPFYLAKDERLYLELKPVLPGWLFSKTADAGFPKNSFVFKFLGKTLVVYHNPHRKDTFGKNSAQVSQIRLKPKKGREIILKSGVIAAPYSYEVRRGNIERIDIFLV